MRNSIPNTATCSPTFPSVGTLVIHRINGVEVLRYQRPQLDPKGEMAPVSDLLDAGAPRILEYGHIALQAEGQPVWFRKIELKSLEAP
jgi:hypothetical protein